MSGVAEAIGTANIVRRFMLMSANIRIIDYPRKGCVHGHVTSVNSGKLLIISETVQDRE